MPRLTALTIVLLACSDPQATTLPAAEPAGDLPTAEPVPSHVGDLDEPDTTLPTVKKLRVIAVRGEQSKDSSEDTIQFTLEGDLFQYDKTSRRGRRVPPERSAFAITEADRQALAAILVDTSIRDTPPHVDTARQSPGTYFTLSVDCEGSDGAWEWAIEGSTGWGREDPGQPYTQTLAYQQGQALLVQLEAFVRERAED